MHDLILRFREEVVVLGVFLRSEIRDRLKPEALYHVLEKVRHGVLEAHSVEKGEEKAALVAWLDVGFVAVDF